MLKKARVLVLALAAGALLQPAAALAADRNHFDDGGRFDRHDTVRVVERDRVPVRRDFDYGARDRFVRPEERVVVRGGYYAPAPQCGRGW